MDAEFLKLMVALLGTAATLIGPSVYYLRFNSNKNDQKNKELISEIQSRHDKALERIENNQKEFNVSIRADLKEFRIHLDGRFTEVYTTVETKLKELREQLSKEMDYIKNHVTKLEAGLETQSEKAHRIEKEILKLENLLSKEYITKDQLDMILKLNQKS